MHRRQSKVVTWLLCLGGRRRPYETDFRREGWIKGDDDGIETIFHPDLKKKITIVNTDKGTCDRERSPRNRTFKGPANEKVTDLNSQLEMFRGEEVGEVPMGFPLWHLCIFDDGKTVRAELSRPVEFKAGYWLKYSERIFIIAGDDWSKISIAAPDAGSDSDDVEINVRRR